MAPKYTETIICLANSRKPRGRCVAGKEIASNEIGDWIRPVSKRPSGELWVDERCYENGDDPRLLDVISIPMIEPRSHDFQSENHLIDDRYYWSKQRVASWKELKSALDKVSGSLWGNAYSSYNGLNDRVAGATAKELDGAR